MKATVVLSSLLAVMLVAAASQSALCARKKILLGFEGEGNETKDIWIPTKEKYEKLNPGVEVVLLPNTLKEKLIASIIAGKAPDLWQAVGFQARDFADNGLLRDLNPLVKADKDFKIGSLQKMAVEDFMYNGKLIGMPGSYRTYAVWINKTLLTNAGLKMPSRGWTWDDYELYCKKLTIDTNKDGRPEQWGSCDPATLYFDFCFQWINSAGGSIVDDRQEPRKFDINPGAQTALAWLKRLVDQKLVRQEFYDPTFYQGKTGMAVYLPIGQRMTTNIKGKFEWDAAYLPAGPKGSINTLDGYGLVMAKNAPHPVEAWKFLKWFCAEGIMNQNQIPANARFRTEKLWPPKEFRGFNPDPFMDAGDDALMTPKIPSYYLVMPPLHQALQAYLGGKKDFNQAFTPAIKQSQELLTRVLLRKSKRQ